MASTGDRAGLVLAGGYSRRFGDREKLLATLDGRPLVAHAVAGLAPAVDGVVVNCRHEQVPGFRDALAAVAASVAVAPDPEPDRGPAAGLVAGLSPVAAPWVAVVTGDAPFVDAAFLDFLFDRAAAREGAVPHLGGHPQVGHAVYRTEAARRAAVEAVTADEGSLRSVADRLDVATVGERSVLERTARRTFRDVNTPADLRDLERGE
jgi:molybdopterin-guanine dinucleotide biosynthesis protein A